MGKATLEHTIQRLVGENVRRLREDRGWTQHELSKASDLHVTYLSGIECGRRNITVGIIARLAEALEVPPGELFREVETASAA